MFLHNHLAYPLTLLDYVIFEWSLDELMLLIQKFIHFFPRFKSLPTLCVLRKPQCKIYDWKGKLRFGGGWLGKTKSQTA